MIRASGWPTLTWSPTATSSSTTPSTGADSACSIFIASTVTTTVPAVDRLPVLDADGDHRTRHGADEFRVTAVFVVGTDRRLPHLLDDRGASVPRQPDLPVCRGDHVVGAQPVECDGEPLAVETALQRAGFAVLDDGRRRLAGCR